MASRGSWIDYLVIAALGFYAASRVIRSDWNGVAPNTLRNWIAWSFYVFGVVLLIISLAHIPGCTCQRQHPGIEKQYGLEGQKPVHDQGKMPENEQQQRKG